MAFLALMVDIGLFYEIFRILYGNNINTMKKMQIYSEDCPLLRKKYSPRKYLLKYSLGIKASMYKLYVC